MFKTLCVIGVGLIGGSVARAARKLCPELHIIGVGREEDAANLQEALRLGVIDVSSFDIAAAVQHVDCVVIATPVGAFGAVLTALKPVWSAQTIYTDVGSTKSNVVSVCEQLFGAVPENFVLGHPIAGAEQSGVTASLEDLFVNKRIILTPVASTNASALAKIQQFWEGMGASVSLMPVAQHDAVLAATSHLPHILAFALVDMLGHKDEQTEIFKYAAGGFRDFTRIASSDPTMWLDICLANKTAISALLVEMQGEIDKLLLAMAQEDAQALFATFTYAKNARQRFLTQFENAK